MFNFLYGESGCLKTEYIFEEIYLSEKEGRRAILIVPEQATYQTELAYLDFIKNKGTFNVEITNLSRLCKRFLDSIGIFNSKNDDNILISINTFLAIFNIKDELKYFKFNENKSNLTFDLAQVFKEFQRFNLSNDNLKPLLEYFNNTDNCNELLANKFNDISNIYNKYLELNQLLNNNENNYKRVSNWLNDNDCDCYISNCDIYIDDFIGFTDEETNLLMKMATVAKSVTISLNCDKLDMNFSKKNLFVHDIFYSSKKTFVELKEKLTNLNIPINLIDLSFNKQKINSSLQYFKQNLFSIHSSNDFNVKNLEQNIEITEHLTIWDEIDYVARNIKKLVMSDEYKFSDIAIIINNYQEYKNYLEIKLDNHEIPLYKDFTYDILNSAIFIWLCSALNIANYNWKTNDVLTHIKTGLTPLNDNECNAIEYYAYENSIDSFKWKLVFDYTKNGLFSNDDEVEKFRNLSFINNAREKIVNSLNELCDLSKKHYTVSQFAQILIEFINNSELIKKINALILDFENKEKLNDAKILYMTFSKIVEVLQTFLNFESEQIFSFNMLSSLFSDTLRNVNLSIPPLSSEAITMYNQERSILKKHKICFIIGCNHDYFPVMNLSEGLVNNEDRKLFESFGINLSYNYLETISVNRFNLYKQFNATQEKLYLSYTLISSLDQSVRPAPLITSIKNAISPGMFKSFSKYNYLQPDFTSFTNANELLLKYLANKKYNLHDVNEKDIVNFDAFLFAFKEKYPLAYENLKNSLIVNFDTNKINKDLVVALYGKNIKSSISKVETFALCPFRYFGEYGLKLKQWNKLEFQRIDAGNIAHNVLEKLLKYMNEHNNLWDQNNLQDVYKVIDELISSEKDKYKDILENNSAINKYTLDYFSTAVKKLAESTIKSFSTSSFKPEKFELVFGKDSKLPALTYQIDDFNVEFTGKIDRVDTCETEDSKYIRVIDYKSKNKEFDIVAANAGYQIQMIIYMKALIENWPDENKTILPSGLFYQNITTSINKTTYSNLINIDNHNLIKDEKYKLSGYIIGSEDTAELMDETKKYNQLPMKNIMSLDEFDNFSNTIENVMSDNLKQICEGNCKAYPVRNGQFTACDYCKMNAICKFNELDNSIYRDVKK